MSLRKWVTSDLTEESLPQENTAPVQDVLTDSDADELREKLPSDSAEYRMDASRYVRLLRLARDHNPQNRLPDALCRSALWLLSLLGAAELIVWGWFFLNQTLLAYTSLALLVLLGGVPLLLVWLRGALGSASWLHAFREPSLRLGPERLAFTLHAATLGHKKQTQPYVWAMDYESINKLEYDRSLKTVRIHGRLNAQESRLPRHHLLPPGMSRQEKGVTLPPHQAYLDIPLYFEQSEELLRALEARTGRFIHTAMRGDDYAELRDLPGLRPERSILRPFSIAALLFVLATLLSIAAVRSTLEQNPYAPYPATDEATLTGAFSVGDSVVLDGVEIGWSEITRATRREGEVCYQVLLVFTNRNTERVRFRINSPLHGSASNLSVAATGADGVTFSPELVPAPVGYAGIEQTLPAYLEPGRNAYATLFFWLPESVGSLTLRINSDYWPPRDILRDVLYRGGTVVIDGVERKSNEVRFTLAGEDLP